MLELGHLLHKQSFSFIDMVDRGDLRRTCTIHCVNLAQGIKEPIIYYQQDTDRKYIDAVKEGFRDIQPSSMDSRKACMEAMRLCMETILHKARSCVRP